MYRGLYFKIILILVLFILIVMSVVGAVLVSSVLNYYNNEFSQRMEENFGTDTQLYIYLKNAMEGAEADEYAVQQKTILTSYSSRLGIDDYRTFYILDSEGRFLAGSDSAGGNSLAMTPNLLTALSGGVGNARGQGSEYADYAVSVENGDTSCIIYIKDTQAELQEVNWMLFTIILQALFVGLIIALTLSFFLARAISLPLARLTEGVQRVAEGDFREKIGVHSNDEIGVLTENFNRMSSMIEENLDEINGEREKLETVLSCLRDAVVTFGEDGKLLQINTAAKKLFCDVDPGRLSLDYIFSLLQYDKGKIDVDLEDSSGVPAVEYKGCVYELYFGNIRYRDTARMREGVILVIHDVTQTFALDRSRREFVANASHELRTPLTTIRMVIEALESDDSVTASETNRSFLSMAETESTRMEMLIKNLLTLSQLDSQTMQFHARPFNITESVEYIAGTLAVNASAKGHPLVFEGTHAPLTVRGDKIRIEQIIINIVSNAIKYTPDGGDIRLRLADCGNTVEIAVSDNGVGIPEEDIPHLFERFYRVEKARSSDKGGTGLGLAIAREFAEAHGGTISVESRVSEGTTFTVTLPKEGKL